MDILEEGIVTNQQDSKHKKKKQVQQKHCSEKTKRRLGTWNTEHGTRNTEHGAVLSVEEMRISSKPK